MKYVIISIDDGTIYDERVVEILNRYHLKGTFNLNSGLDDYVWYSEGRPVKRLHLPSSIVLYKGHEIASHSLTHPHLTECSSDHIGYEVGVDMENLGNIFQAPIRSFAFPFEDFDERCINRIKDIGGIEAIRVSEVDPSFRFPPDPFHIKITSLDINEAVELFPRFLEDENAKLFVFVSHGYDFEFNNSYGKLAEFARMVGTAEGVSSIYTRELPEVIRKQS